MTAPLKPDWANPTQPNSEVSTLMRIGDALLVGGKFSMIDTGFSNNYIAAFDPDGNLYEGWKPTIGTGPPKHINSLAVLGSTLFIGGSFFAFYNETISPGTPLAFMPIATTDAVYNLSAQLISPKNVHGIVEEMTVSTNYVYVVDNWGSIDAFTEEGFLKAAWPSVRVLADQTEAQIIINDLIFTGGRTHPITVPEPGWSGLSVTGTDGVLRSNLILPYSTEVDNNITALATDGSMIFATGRDLVGFTIPGSQTTRNLIAFDANGVIDTSWLSRGGRGVTEMAVYADSLFIGFIGGLAVVNTLDGTSKNLGWESNGRITSIVPTATRTYVGGTFTSFGGKSRANFVILDENGNVL